MDKVKDRMAYVTINELKRLGKELCGYVRNPTNKYKGTCAFGGGCDDIFSQECMRRQLSIIRPPIAQVIEEI
jgi:hypothetical protein